jgi:peptidoglycan hydrolase-like protein with peptidoglycan-binding domain
MRLVVVAAALTCGLALAFPVTSAAGTSRYEPSPSVAALQVALRAQGHYAAPVDGVDGPLTQAALRRLREQKRIREAEVGPRTRAALGRLGRPLLGQRELGIGAAGWDVSALEFQLRRYGLPAREVDGSFTPVTAAALRRFQAASGLTPDGWAGRQTYRALVRGAGGSSSRPRAPQPVRVVHVVRDGESFFAIAQRYGVSPLLLAKENGLHISSVIVPGQRLTLPVGAKSGSAGSTDARAATGPSASADQVRAALDRWSAVYGVDPKLARALAWMESGFQEDVVSNVGAIGVMQLLPETWDWLDALIGVRTPRTYDGNVRAGVRYLRWLLEEFDGNTRLALAGYYQGARAVRERGLFDDTKQYVTVILRLYGSV